MKRSTEIVDELSNISSLLAGIEKRNVFSVPEGYFDVLSIGIIKKVNTSTSEFQTNNLAVPEGYFENLSVSVLNKIKLIQDEPAQEVKTLSPMLYSLQNENVFDVPVDYFKNLQNDILGKVKSLQDEPEQELRALSPMLYSLQSENVFDVPVGYFKNLQDNVLDKVIEKPQAKVVQLKNRDSVWKYAVAAVLTGFIGLSSLMFLNKSNHQAGNKSNEISVSSSATQFKNEQQINQAIATLSDDEIIKYLEKTGNDIDNETLATSIDENELPAAKDYLIDEKTLDTYLDQMNKNSQN